MRTTLTIDDEVAVRIERLRRERGTSLKQLINELLRSGLDQHARRPPPRRRRYRIEPVDLGPRVADLDNVADVLAVHEGEDWR